ncbi:unnamed protein product, partial [Iphiclides podalirius]
MNCAFHLRLRPVRAMTFRRADISPTVVLVFAIDAIKVCGLVSVIAQRRKHVPEVIVDRSNYGRNGRVLKS